MKLKDIYKHLDKNIDISYTYISKKLKISEKLNIKRDIDGIRKKRKKLDISGFCNTENTKVEKELEPKNDIDGIYNKRDNLDISGLKNPVLIKNNTQNFDSFVYSKKLKNIVDTRNRFSFFDKLMGKHIFFSNHLRPFGIFALTIKVLFILSFLLGILYLDKILVTSYVESGYKRLLKIEENTGDILLMKKNLNDAKFDFIFADILYTPFLFIPKQDIRNGYAIIKGGKELTNIGDNLLRIYSEVKKLAEIKGISNIALSHLFKNLKNDFEETEERLKNTIEYYKKIENLPSNYTEFKLREATQKLEKFLGYNHMINTYFGEVLSLLGDNEEKKYLVVFQNADEIRPTGGFMGSMGIATIEKGKLKSFEKKDVYSFEWDLKNVDYNRLRPPEGINKLTDKLGLRDSNYSINIENSSKNIKFFIEKSGYKIDGVIYVNQNIILDILEKTGGVKMKSINEEITHNNFSSIISTIVESKLTKIGTLGTPKQILFDFIEIFSEQIESQKKYSDVINVLVDNLISRDIMIWSFDKSENLFLSEIGWNGKIDYESSLDFAYPVFTSISGNKSDRYIKRKYTKNITINPDCSIDTKLGITLKHLFTKNKEKEITNLINEYGITDAHQTLKVQGNGPNHSFVRILLPKNAIIEKGNLVSIIEHKSSKEVNFYIKTQKLETRSFYIHYKIPNIECSEYNFKLYKQPGIRNYDMEFFSKNESIQKSGVLGDFYYSKE